MHLICIYFQNTPFKNEGKMNYKISICFQGKYPLTHPSWEVEDRPIGGGDAWIHPTSY